MRSLVVKEGSLGRFVMGLVLTAFLCATPFSTRAHDHEHENEPGHRVDFVENKGQWPSQVLFRAQCGYTSLFLEKDCFTIVASAPTDSTEWTPEEAAAYRGSHSAQHFMRRKWHAYRMRFVGASAAPTLLGQYLADDYDNYYLGSDASKWASHCRKYGMVEYKELYAGIDLRVYSAEKVAKYEFEVAPHVDASQIRMEYDSVWSLQVRNGSLVALTHAGEIVEMAPYVYQETAAGLRTIQASFEVKGNAVGFNLGAYDKDLPLVIDPFLYFSTYTGSTANNWGTTAAYDSYKNAYTAGLVFTAGYPTSLGAYDSTYNGNCDIGIFKFDGYGAQRLYATYLGGNYADMPHSMFVNELDELVVFGTTGSDNFPTTEGAYCRTFKGGSRIAYLSSNSMLYPTGSDIFVSRFSADGTTLGASTYVGGSSNDGLNYRSYYNNTTNLVTTNRVMMDGNDSLYFNYGDGARGEVITDDLNNVYVGTTTFSNDFFANGGSIQRRNHGGQEGVVFKLDYNLSRMLWGTYFGGFGDDAIYSIDLDNQYNAVICGGSNSPTLPTTPSAYHPTAFGGSADGFVAKISYYGDSILASTYFGSSAYDQAYFVRCGRHDEVFLFGQTKATGSTLIQNAYYNTPNSGQFIARLTPDLGNLVWSTTFGTGTGRPNISPTAFGVDICNRTYAVGWGRDFADIYGFQTGGTTNMEVTNNAFQSQTDGQDFYILALAEDASHIDYASYFGELHDSYNSGGSDHVDGGTSRFDRLGTLYQSVCASCNGASFFPTTGGVWSQTNPSPSCNNALFRYNINDDFAVAEFVQPPAGCAPYTVAFHNTGRGTTYEWDFGDGTSSTEENPTHQYAATGQYTVRLIARLPGGCAAADTTEHVVMVLGANRNDTLPATSCDGSPMQIGIRQMPGCTYQWLQGEVSDSTIANPWVTEGGTYILHITSDAGCDETDTFQVRFIRLIDTLFVTPTSCPNSCDGMVVAVTNTDLATGSIQYDWDGAMLPDSILIDQCRSAEIHTLTVSDNLCQESATYTIPGPEPMDIQKEGQFALCSDTCNAWIHLWSSQGTDTTLANLCDGTYVIALTDTLGCPYEDSTIVIVDHALDNFRAWADDTIIFLGESAFLHATDIPGAEYLWSPSAHLSSVHDSTTYATPTDTLETYLVSVTDTYGCTASDTLNIHCIKVNCGEGNIFIPNAFTPNGDGINDRFCVTGDWVVDFHIVIYTRWGELIYESDDISQCWDGRYKDNWCMPGVYVYSCQITCEAGQQAAFKGNITIIR